MPDDVVQLLINGRIYGGWLRTGVTRAMDAASGTFNLSVTDRWSADSQPWRIVPGNECEIRIGSDTVISGYVDLVRPGFSSSDHSIEVQGRDRSADMIDCSAVHKPDEWKRITLLQLAQTLAGPFGVSVKTETDMGATLDLVKLQQGETALEALNRHAKMRKVLVMPDGKGGILLTRTGARRASTDLVQGVNILSATGTLDWSERYSEYIVKGQARYSKTTDTKVEAHAVGRAKDEAITRYRPLLVVADTDANVASATDRADWEANTRIGKSGQASITVQGWRQTPGGSLWEPNMLVHVISPWLGIEGEMLIRQVTFNKDSGGTTTQLDIVSPQAYEAEPPDGKQKSKKRKSNGKSSSGAWGEGVGEDVREWMGKIGGTGGK